MPNGSTTRASARPSARSSTCSTQFARGISTPRAKSADGAGANGATTRAAAFREFQARGGAALRRHALFDTLQEHFSRTDPHCWGWPAWPQAYRDPESAAVAAFADEASQRVEFFEYLQWQVALQLGAARRRAEELGLGVGVYQDLAVSVDRGGAEVWSNPSLYATAERRRAT